MALPDSLTHRQLEVNGLSMHVAEAGSGEPVLFLHGFPEFWYSWRHQLAALAPSYRVIAPDLRGYNETERRGPYDTGTLVADVAGLLDALDVKRAHIVGHDWGGAVAWLFAMTHPERVITLTNCNIPHPAVFQRSLWRNPRQLLRSWYIAAFQVPWLPQRLIAAGNYRRLARAMINDCAPGTFTKEDIRLYLAAWRRQGLSGGINWYRGLVRSPRRLPKPVPVITAPTLLIWGEEDQFLGRELTRGTGAYVADLRTEFLPAVSHWVQQEAHEAVSALIAGHIEQHAGA
jgi:pimeloyl-ACP methyl ester carboxylesterase